jgi:hypothetical protein
MKRWAIAGALVATLGFAALQATPGGVDPLGQENGDIEEPDVEREPPPEPKPKAKPAPKEVVTKAKVKAPDAVAAIADPASVTPQMPALPPSPPPVERASSLTPSKLSLPAPPAGKSTPMADRVAVVGLLNKRNGLWQDLVMKPGEARRIGDVVVRLKACEKTAPWENEQLTGAYVQLLVNDTDKKWRRYFSGWLYRESPSLNVVEHPVYDVWTKECRMRTSDVGENTTMVRGGDTPKERKSDEEE